MMDFLSCTCYLVISVASQHLGATGLNQSNPGIGIEVNSYHVGEYRNSLGRTSVYAGKDWETAGTVKAGILVGAVSGYNHIAGSAILPLVAPFIAIEKGRFGANIALLPNPIQWNESALALQLKVTL